MVFAGRIARVALAVVTIGLAQAAYAGDADTDASIDSLLGDHHAYRSVIEALQQGVANQDADAVAALVSYPIKVSVGGKTLTIKSASAFASRYDDIVTPEIADVIEKQKYADLFVNSDGIMFGNGEVWINGICQDDACSAFDAKVITIQPAQ